MTMNSISTRWPNINSIDLELQKLELPSKHFFLLQNVFGIFWRLAIFRIQIYLVYQKRIDGQEFLVSRSGVKPCPYNLPFHQDKFLHDPKTNFLAGNYMFKVKNINTGTRREICSKLTIKTLERHWRLVSLLLTLNIFPCSSVIVNFEQVHAKWVRVLDNF